ncbi:MAG: ScyD/ScyE family protein, partial [Ardenticatenaceae bacterium]
RYSTLNRLRPGGDVEILAGGVGSDGFPATQIVNPYDLAPAPDGDGFLVSDSGANAVFRVSQSGEITDFAAFERRQNPRFTSGSDAFRFMEVVPTGIALGPDGAVYLASLTGFPYPPGTAQVYRLEDLNGDGDALDQGEATVFAEGFTAATDLAFEADGSLLVTEYSGDMLRLIQEFGVDEAERVPGRLVRWQDGAIEVVEDGLVSPTSIAVAGEKIFVSEEFAGRVSQVGALEDGVPLLWPGIAGILAAGVVLMAFVGVIGVKT